MNNKQLIPIIIIIAVLVAGGIGFWHWSQKKVKVSETPTETSTETPAIGETKDGLGAEVFNKTNNPLSNELPETNPFGAQTNPFK